MPLEAGAGLLSRFRTSQWLVMGTFGGGGNVVSRSPRIAHVKGTRLAFDAAVIWQWASCRVPIPHTGRRSGVHPWVTPTTPVGGLSYGGNNKFIHSLVN